MQNQNQERDSTEKEINRESVNIAHSNSCSTNSITPPFVDSFSERSVFSSHFVE